MTTDVTIRTGGPADIDRLRPLWLSVHARHRASMPQLAPYVGDDASWASRSALYRDLLESRDPGVLALAERAGRLVGYGVARVQDARETWVQRDTWVTAPRIGEIESLAVLPEDRGQGIGSRLLDTLIRRLRDRGVDELVVGALHGNAAAIRLYERHGFAPTWLYLSRFAARHAG